MLPWFVESPTLIWTPKQNICIQAILLVIAISHIRYIETNFSKFWLRLTNNGASNKAAYPSCIPMWSCVHDVICDLHLTDSKLFGSPFTSS